MVLQKLALQVIHSFVVNRTVASVSAGIIAVVVIAGSGATYALHNARQTTPIARPSQTTLSTPSPTPTPSVVSTVAPVVTPKLTTDSGVTSQPAQTPAVMTPSTTPVTPTTVQTQPAVPAHVKPGITISSDGCRVIAIGDAGLVFVTGSYKPGHHGGQSAYTMPTSQSMTENVGGPKGDKVFGELIDAAGTVLVQVSTVITSDTCTAGSPSTVDGFFPMPADA